ncbi:hypothetical protein [Enhygromyxa salina]|uniref:Dipeptide-binding ABC transporter, periplasmic substrate-binding component n=1 Tax=Enhygromyxa salina TaxID=215803 RepID=A0A2S9YIX7_9BACT|nr:hypothetical protein [Enhygromyxa salina]PRQ05054.1 hypothetical protein ENSA7_48070 [Enhygromyxa salina]
MTSRIGLIRIVCVLPLLSLGCGPDGPASESDGSETGDGDGDPGDGDGDPGDGDADGDPGDGDGDGDPGDGDGDPGDCEPAGDAYSFFALDAAEPDAMIDWELTCKSSGVKPADGESGYQIGLVECVSEGLDPMPPPTEVVLTIDSSPATQPFIEVGVGVRLHWVQRPPFIPGKWFTLHTTPGDTQGTLLLAGVSGPAVVPQESPSFDYAPLGVGLVSIGCPTFEHDSQCGLAERQAFEVSWDGDTVVVSDHNFGYVGQLISYQAIVGEALEFPQLDCDDFPARILSALFMLIPEG